MAGSGPDLERYDAQARTSPRSPLSSAAARPGIEEESQRQVPSGDRSGSVTAASPRPSQCSGYGASNQGACYTAADRSVAPARTTFANSDGNGHRAGPPLTVSCGAI